MYSGLSVYALRFTLNPKFRITTPLQYKPTLQRLKLEVNPTECASLNPKP